MMHIFEGGNKRMGCCGKNSNETTPHQETTCQPCRHETKTQPKAQKRETIGRPGGSACLHLQRLRGDQLMILPESDAACSRS